MLCHNLQSSVKFHTDLSINRMFVQSFALQNFFILVWIASFILYYTNYMIYLFGRSTHHCRISFVQQFTCKTY